jgi:hypothetical protein
MLDKEGVANPADIGVLGKDEVLAGIERLRRSGSPTAASEMPGNDDERVRTRGALVAALT